MKTGDVEKATATPMYDITHKDGSKSEKLLLWQQQLSNQLVKTYTLCPVTRHRLNNSTLFREAPIKPPDFLHRRVKLSSKTTILPLQALTQYQPTRTSCVRQPKTTRLALEQIYWTSDMLNNTLNICQICFNFIKDHFSHYRKTLKQFYDWTQPPSVDPTQRP